jgi:hypothetical protein
MVADPAALERLGRRFWVALGTTVLLGFAAVVGGVWWFDLAHGFGVALTLSLAPLFWGLSAVELALGNRLGGTGQAITGVGWLVWGIGWLTGFSGPTFWAGLVTILCGTLVGLYADFGTTLPAAVGR